MQLQRYITSEYLTKPKFSIKSLLVEISQYYNTAPRYARHKLVPVFIRVDMSPMNFVSQEKIMEYMT